MEDIFDLPVHPDADAFRMLPPDEMRALAEDIKQRGLNHPLVITTLVSFDEETGEKIERMVLVDGRNRREACRIAGVKPDVVDLNGKDVKAFIQAENDLRRHDTPGMRAMSYAIRFPEKSKGGRGNKLSPEKTVSEPSRDYIYKARLVLEYCDSAIVESVKNGAITLTDAYAQAKDIKEGKKGPTDVERLALLYQTDPDLAAAVEDPDNPLNLTGAEAQAKERRVEAKANRDAAHRSLRDGIYAFGSFFLDEEKAANASLLLTEYKKDFEEISAREISDATRYLVGIRDNIQTLIDGLENV